MSNGDKCVCGDKETWHKKCYAEQAEASSLSDLLASKLEKLLTEFGNINFDCGRFEDEDSDGLLEYKKMCVRARELKKQIMSLITAC